jgi:hypothetical protein
MFHNQAGDLYSPIGIHLTLLSEMLAIHNNHSVSFEPVTPEFMNPMNDINT